ncbi:MAG: efflux RND transporter periplasmic adaptor subunit [Thermoanaerobaculia bacterium]
MKKRVCLLLAGWIALAAASGCRRSGTEPSAGEAGQAAGGQHAEAEKHEEMATGEAEDRLVRIAPEMLRDLKLTLANAEARQAGQSVSVLGEVKVDENAYAAVAAPIPARVLALRAEPGQRVRAGQPLAELQSVELGRARAAHESATARAELAEQTLERKRGLAAERIVSQGELQQAEAAAAEARAEARAARASLAALGVSTSPAADPSRFALLSPIAGTVLERHALRGETADPAEPLFRIADLSRLWLVAQAFERDAVRVQEGAAVEITLAALPGRTVRGTVARVGREVASESRTVPVRIDLPNPDGLLRPGMSATVQLPLADSTGTVVTVPTAAFQHLEEGWSVFIPRGEGVFEARAVGRGRDLGGEIEILSGLKAGTPVVVEGAFLLKAEADKSHGGGEHHHD